MTDRMTSFLIRLAEDADARAAFEAAPETQMDGAGLSDDERRAILARDDAAIFALATKYAPATAKILQGVEEEPPVAKILQGVEEDRAPVVAKILQGVEERDAPVIAKILQGVEEREPPVIAKILQGLEEQQAPQRMKKRA